MLPITTEPTPILAVPVVATSPSIFAASAKNSEEELLPCTVPVTTSLPLHAISPTTFPSTLIEPTDSKLPLIDIPAVIIAVSSATGVPACEGAIC